MATLARVRTIFTGPAGSPWYSNLYFDAATGTAQNAADAAATFWGAVDNLMKTTVSWSTQAQVYEIDSSTGEPTGTVSVTTATGSGSSTADLLPPATQGVVSLHTGVFVGGREVRGRIFVPGLSEDQCGSTGLWASAATATTAVAALIADTNTRFQVYSRTHGLGYDVVSGAGQPNFGVLRSRRD